MAVPFSIIGGAGFRAQYFLRIAAAMPERFTISGLVVRDEEKGRAMEAQWGVKTYRTLENLLAQESPSFAVVSVGWAECTSYLMQLADLGIPALSETPPAPDIEGLRALHERLTLRGAKVQVAEQYWLHPVQQARLELIRAGRIGPVTETTVSISQTYHAISLMRKMLGVTYDNAVIRGTRFSSQWVSGPNRSGPPSEDKLIPLQRDLAWFDFGGKLGIYDWTKDQHRSWTRSNHLNVRGERGEIWDQRVLIQQEDCSELRLELQRINKGEWENPEGYHLKGILCGDQWVYENRFAPARLYDDEIAIADCLQRMANYAAGGPSFYSLAEASQDHYLGLMMEQAITTGETVTTERQCWAE